MTIFTQAENALSPINLNAAPMDAEEGVSPPASSN